MTTNLEASELFFKGDERGSTIEDGHKAVLEGGISITDKIRTWSVDRNLHEADSTKQALKLGEEFGELFEGMALGDEALIKDAIGDMYVVMTILSQQYGFTIEECIELAYDEIKDRKGRMIDGVFVKESDLKQSERGEGGFGSTGVNSDG